MAPWRLSSICTMESFGWCRWWSRFYVTLKARLLAAQKRYILLVYPKWTSQCLSVHALLLHLCISDLVILYTQLCARQHQLLLLFVLLFDRTHTHTSPGAHFNDHWRRRIQFNPLWRSTGNASKVQFDWHMFGRMWPINAEGYCRLRHNFIMLFFFHNGWYSHSLRLLVELLHESSLHAGN